jgi:hypothetical protein
MQKPSFAKAESAFISSVMSTPFQTSEILIDGLLYSYTWNEEEAKNDNSKILVGYDERGNPTVKVTDKQKKEAEDILRASFRAKLDREYKEVFDRNTTNVEATKPKPPTEAERKAIVDSRKNEVNVKFTQKVRSELYPEMIDRIPSNSAGQVRQVVSKYGLLVEPDGDELLVYHPVLGQDKGLRIQTAGGTRGGKIQYDQNGRPVDTPENKAKYQALEASMDALAKYVSDMSDASIKLNSLGLDPTYFDASYQPTQSQSSTPTSNNVDELIQVNKVPDLKAEIQGIKAQSKTTQDDPTPAPNVSGTGTIKGGNVR